MFTIAIKPKQLIFRKDLYITSINRFDYCEQKIVLNIYYLDMCILTLFCILYVTALSTIHRKTKALHAESTLICHGQLFYLTLKLQRGVTERK